MKIFIYRDVWTALRLGVFGGLNLWLKPMIWDSWLAGFVASIYVWNLLTYLIDQALYSMFGLDALTWTEDVVFRPEMEPPHMCAGVMLTERYDVEQMRQLALRTNDKHQRFRSTMVNICGRSFFKPLSDSEY